jgi:hypothetical protein
MEVAANGAEGEDAWPGAQKLNMAQEILDINKCVSSSQEPHTCNIWRLEAVVLGSLLFSVVGRTQWWADQ